MDDFDYNDEKCNQDHDPERLKNVNRHSSCLLQSYK